MKIKKILLLGLLTIAIGLSGCASARGEKVVDTNSKVPVETIAVDVKTITQQYDTVGKLHAYEEVIVSGNANGIVKTINFNVGDKVKEGDILYTLENKDLLNNIDMQKNSLQKTVEDSRIMYEDALGNYNSIKSLYEANAVSKEDLENAQVALDRASLNYQQAKKTLESNTVSFNSSIEDTIIRSPIAGVVSSRNIEIGERTSGASFIISKLDPMLVKTNVSEDFVNTISVGNQVKVTVQQQQYIGKVKTINPVGVNNSNMYPVEIVIENDGSFLKHGMFAEIAFELETLDNQIVVPKKTILSEGSRSYVYIVENQQPKKVAVEKGLTKDGEVQIVKGLKAGDMLIVMGHEYIDEQTEIKVVNQN
ncbi:efflux RND transporter periplasmic adaptor subunit [Alkaliphilus pronyensis]|uniref:Efflux RND transporter periplasmic adaptor subunit n=1 Tax=Alkaliphilus pronyensis TaxID=1482732 RepID=A0A6I0EYN6_9FIRM|nr:efflux RND transporter periplasmic adaptor subunit [Alkaliphilus pronyensis]KAB3530677.1 efflux RND transporter periplasmic adaptor subunit [Alkaliphilus pronyensis]